MKIRERMASGTCEGCDESSDSLNVVTFERADEVKLLCNRCLEWTRELLELVDVKEAEA